MILASAIFSTFCSRSSSAIRIHRLCLRAVSVYAKYPETIYSLSSLDWQGLMVSAATAGFTGAFFGVVWPFTGHQGFGLMQTGINALIGPYTLFCLYKAYSNIRARNFGEHREWMIRTFALMLGVATQRVLMIVLIPLTGISAETMFASCMVLGMIINIGISEYWINLTRTPARVIDIGKISIGK